MKQGFTLAEILITLGIIGVVAALTAPALVQNAGNAKVGPTLTKVISTLENAHEQMLNDEGATKLDSITKGGGWSETRENYYIKLSKYIQGSSYDNDFAVKFEPATTSYNNTKCETGDYDFNNFDHRVPFYFSDTITLFAYKTDYADSKSKYKAKGSFRGEYMNLYVDINGPTVKPNVIGRDIFYFKIDNGGKVIPMGGKTSKWLLDESFYYTSDGDYACNEDNVTIGLGCAGSIFDNNGKVIYK